MPITVLSPFSGHPVKVRDQDAGRAVKDEEGRLFYVLPKSDGSGYYGATTRAGNPKEEARAQELAAKVGTSAVQAKEQVQISLQAVSHPRPSRAKWVVLGLVIVAGVVAWALYYGPLKSYNPWAPSTSAPAPHAAPATPPAAPATP